jgi:GMP synthase PP-ATPase subunit
MARAERIVADILASAPECEPAIRIAGAPAEEREEFLRDAERLAIEAVEQQGLLNVVWRVVEREGRLYGVLYGESCDLG